ncbi:MAG: HPr family phosphocarrier protein [Puniceicoccales bacterium]|jgi:phosphocarrier protein|nr:HPr family phosphocarrier protein [Puniceicoccales bacterium]
MEPTEPPAEPVTIKRDMVVGNRNGVHTRPAALIVRTANKYPKVELLVAKGSEQVNAKSIMGLMMLAAGNGSKLHFIATGASEQVQSLLDELQKLFDSRFNEE